ncbi:MAG TPA: type VI secretion system baseplate subunit TssG [Pyrinomonadaceae bacterium]|nr:type VI secretion system baseplate subunit TssG [Pyrinomonadaceae bacterium]
MGAHVGRSDTPVKNYGWGKETTIEDWLFDEGHQFDFFQAVRLLEIIHSTNGDDPADHREQISPPGHAADPTREIVHFRSAVKLDFPASDIEHVKRKQDIPLREQPAAPSEMTVNFLGLAGCLGALDISSTELVLQRTSHNDKALRDFLDIFNHRLVSLLYRIRKHHRVGLVSSTPGEDHVARYLYALIGLGTPRLHGRMHVRDRSLLHYAGILAQQPRSMAGLRQILSDYFRVEVKIVQFTGKWCELEEDQWTTIGRSGKNQRLGQDSVVVGTRVWDQHARFEIHLGPLGLKEFESFLPTEWRFGALCDLVRFYVKDEFDFNVRLTLKAAEIPTVSLSTEPALSWNSWLGPLHTVQNNGHKPQPGEDPYIVITPEALRLESSSIKSRFLHRLPRGKQAELLSIRERTIPKSRVVMLQGDPGVEMYVIRRGRVQLSRCEEHGKETVIGVLSEGDTFGERAMLRSKPYSETALALTECEISVLTREDLRAVVDNNPSLRRTIEAYRNHEEPEVAPYQQITRR